MFPVPSVGRVGSGPVRVILGLYSLTSVVVWLSVRAVFGLCSMSSVVARLSVRAVFRLSSLVYVVVRLSVVAAGHPCVVVAIGCWCR